MNDVEKMEMPVIISGNENNESNENMESDNEIISESSESSSSEEERPDINQEDVFETPIIQKVKEKPAVTIKMEKPSITIKDEITDFEEIGNIIEEYKNGDTRFDGKIYYNGKWKTQPQLDQLKRMREKRWAGHVKAEKKAAPKNIVEPVKSVSFDEDMLEKVALRAVNAYKEQRKSKKKKEKPAPTAPVDIPIKKEHVEKHYDPISNDINSRFTAEELEYRDCFF